MKGFWIALVLLLTLTVGVFWTAHRVDDALKELTAALTTRSFEESESLWEKHKRLLRLTLHQGEMTQIDERLAALLSAASLGDEATLEIERARLLSVLLRARDTVSPSLSDVF